MSKINMILRYSTLETKKLLEPIRGSIALTDFVISLTVVATKSRKKRAIIVEPYKTIHLKDDATVMLNTPTATIDGTQFNKIPRGFYTGIELSSQFRKIHKGLILTPTSLTIPNNISIVLSETLLRALDIDMKYKGIWLTHTTITFGTSEKTEPISSEKTEPISPEKTESEAVVNSKEPVVICDIPAFSLPNILFLTCDQLNTEQQAHNGEPSNILAIIPTKNQQNIVYTPHHITYCPLDTSNDHQELTFKLFDQHMNPVIPTYIHFNIANNEYK